MQIFHKQLSLCYWNTDTVANDYTGLRCGISGAKEHTDSNRKSLYLVIIEALMCVHGLKVI